MTTKEYLLQCFSEELVETAQRVSKALRFGLDEVQDGQDLNNAQRIIYEFTDVMALYLMLQKENLIGSIDLLSPEIQKKKEKVYKYMEYSRQKGIIND